MLTESPGLLLGLEQRFNHMLMIQAGRCTIADPVPEPLGYPTARALVKLNEYRELSGTVTEYLPERDRYKFVTKKGARVYLHRIFICFDIESPRDFAKRL